LAQSKKNMLNIGGQGGAKLERRQNKSKLIARLGVHNVKNMPVADVAMMTIFNQQKNRMI
jgi:hypothetical protein